VIKKKIKIKKKEKKANQSKNTTIQKLLKLKNCFRKQKYTHLHEEMQRCAGMMNKVRSNACAHHGKCRANSVRTTPGCKEKQATCQNHVIQDHTHAS
jgi:hypothetical protein